MIVDPLRETLVDLALMLKPNAIELIVGGGYGLLLRSELIIKRGHFSRLGIDMIVRSTSDLDCFLGADVISDSDKTRRIAEALQTLDARRKLPPFSIAPAVLTPVVTDAAQMY